MKSSEIACFLCKSLVGDDIEITSFSSLSNIKQQSLVFAKKYSQANVEVLNNNRVLALVCPDYDGLLTCPYIVSNNPRLDFAKAVQTFFIARPAAGIHPTAVVEAGAIIGKNVYIGPHCHIGPQVSIGDNTVIQANVTLINSIRIGNNCQIKPGAVLGGEGFGYEYDEDCIPVHFPHTGDIFIGNNVSIGSNTCIDRATIDTTIIEDNVKIDNLVHIGHNVHIRKNSFIIAGTVICGGVDVGENCWVSPNSTLHQKIIIGNKAKVGIGSVVIGRVREGQTVFGVPAKRV